MLNKPKKNVEHAQKMLNTPKCCCTPTHTSEIHLHMRNTPENTTHNNHRTDEDTQPNARTHLTKHGQNTKTQILAKCGLAKRGHKKQLPKAVLAKFVHDQAGRGEDPLDFRGVKDGFAFWGTRQIIISQIVVDIL